jgi:hypothetical protein
LEEEAKKEERKGGKKKKKNHVDLFLRIFLAMGQSKWLIHWKEGGKKTPPKNKTKKQKKRQ